ncbi:hypothetical protein NEFER03_1945 [Nematocida sp. LUAm3]|nr:hypothetical protein NEFER03_1945 [Nematocida sp. LUAm3]KAI5176153.1 hypothetical protein NEFER02_1967 [Nematocida sp. LUAm2]KAI5179349.1 hypothetical protein NEFER01_2190 [Nematocida sp. LUAm1]
MRKIRNTSVLSITRCILILLLLFYGAHSTRRIGLACRPEEKEELNILMLSNYHSILYSPSEGEQEDKTVVALKEIIKKKAITQEAILYLVVYCNNWSIEFVGDDKKYYSTVNTKYILDLLNNEAYSKKYIWIIATSSVYMSKDDIKIPKKIADFFLAICTERNVLLEYMGFKQHKELLEKTTPPITRYTIRLRKLVTLWKYFKLYEERGEKRKWNLIVCNVLGTTPKPTNFIQCFTNIFIETRAKFNRVFIIKDVPNDNSVNINKSEERIIQLMGIYANPVYTIILDYLKLLNNNTACPSYIDSGSPTTSLKSQSITAHPNIVSFSHFIFIFSSFNHSSENVFPFQTILDIANIQNRGIFAEMLDGSMFCFSIMCDYSPRQVVLSLDFWSNYNYDHLYFLINLSDYFFMIPNVNYDAFYLELQKKRNIKFPFKFSTLPQNTQQLLTFAPKHNNFLITSKLFEKIYPNSNISGMAYYAQNHIVIMQGNLQKSMPTGPNASELFNVLFSKNKIILKPNPLEKNISIEIATELESFQSDVNIPFPNKRARLNPPNNASSSVCSIQTAVTSDDREAKHTCSVSTTTQLAPIHHKRCSNFNSDHHVNSNLPPSLINDILSLEEDYGQHSTT